MPNYRRPGTAGAKWFFTVVTNERRPILTLPTARTALRNAIVDTREQLPFVIDAWVLLPDHLHCIWQLPEGDTDFSKRWGVIKAAFTRRMKGLIDGTSLPSKSRLKRHEHTFWQRRFWEHCIRDNTDMRRHLDYIHFNPVKHGYSAVVVDWPWSSFHRYVADGVYMADWGGDAKTFEIAKTGE